MLCYILYRRVFFFYSVVNNIPIADSAQTWEVTFDKLCGKDFWKFTFRYKLYFWSESFELFACYLILTVIVVFKFMRITSQSTWPNIFDACDLSHLRARLSTCCNATTQSRITFRRNLAFFLFSQSFSVTAERSGLIIGR